MSATKEFVFNADLAVRDRLLGDGDPGGQDLSRRRCSGGRELAAASSSTRRYNPPPQPIFYRDGSVSRDQAEQGPENAVQEGMFGFRRRRRPLLPRRGAAGGQPHARRVPARSMCRLARRPRPARISSTGPRATPRRRRRRGSSSGRRTSTCSQPSIAISSASIDFGMFAWLVVPLLRALKWVNGYVGNYGWSIIVADGPDQRGDVPAAAQERRVDAEDAGDPAAR